MADNSTAREAWITGIGIVSCLGEGPAEAQRADGPDGVDGELSA